MHRLSAPMFRKLAGRRGLVLIALLALLGGPPQAISGAYVESSTLRSATLTTQ